MNFNRIEKSDILFKNKKYLKNRDISILEFQMRILDLIPLDDTPFMEKFNFIKIVSSNLEEFISVRLSNIKENAMNVIHIIESIFLEMSQYLNELNSVSEIEIETNDLYKVIPHKNLNYIHSGGNDKIILDEMNDVVDMKTSNDTFTVLHSNPDFEYPNAVYHIFVPKNILLLSQYVEEYEKKYKKDSSVYYKKDVEKYIPCDFYSRLQNQDILIHNPYESYDYVTEFIKQMCMHPNIEEIFITLYRTAKESVIIESLIKAVKLGKRVNVFIEPFAREDENNNMKNILKLRKHGVFVRCSYYNYKVHCKLFCAVDKERRLYCHIGTGNYNESTAKLYTDFQLLTSNQDICKEAISILLNLFTKKEYCNSHNHVFSSPSNLRRKISQLIDKECEKGKDGRIIIKCNNLCDCGVISKLYNAADNGVQIQIICRTGCSILPRQNIEIRSKVGKYLEHERFYIFGDEMFISSADLLLRNLSKRVEVLCEIVDPDNKSKLLNTFHKLWNDPLIHRLSLDGRWEIES